jgi:hypothetical protein
MRPQRRPTGEAFGVYGRSTTIRLGWDVWEEAAMIRVSRARSRRIVDDDERVERFVGSMLLFGVLLVAAGVLYVGWYILGPH